MKYDFTLPIIEINPITKDPEITVWALTVKEFKSIYDGDKRADKKLALALLTYVGLLEDYSMWIQKMPENKHLEYAKKNSGILKLKKDFVPNNTIRNARKRYSELQREVCTEMKLLFAAEKALENLTNAIVRISNEAGRISKKADLEEKDVVSIDNSIDMILNKTGKLSERLSIVKDLQKQVADRRREEVIANIKGGGTAGSRERPEDSIFLRDRAS